MLRLFSTKVPFHMQFQDTPNPLQKAQFLAKTITPLLKSTTKVLSGSKNKDWTHGYAIAVEGMKGIMKEIVTEPNVLLVQELSSKAVPVPRKAKLTLDSIPVNLQVVEFLKEFQECEQSSGDIQGEWIDTKYSNEHRIIYELHGGAYCLGSAGMYRNIHDSMSRYTKARVFGLNYRLAPQYPFPCGLIDSVSGYLELRKRYPEASITLMGDSAGGGLVLATLLCLRDMKAKGWDIDMPKGAFCLSPWIDLTHSFPSFQLGDSNDYLPLGIVDSRLGDRKHYYTTNENLKNPYVSPLFAESFEGIPPVLLTVGSFEKLYDEVVELSNKLPSRQLEIYKSHVHVFQVFPMADAAELSLKRAAKFLDKCFQEKEIESLKIEYDFHGVKVSSESL